MEKDNLSKKEALKTWLLNFIDEIRTSYEALDESSRSQSEYVDLRNNCQIEVFWLEYPENQVIVFTFNSERYDKEVFIYGPSNIEPLLDEVAEVTQTDRWNSFADVARFAPKKGAKAPFARAFELLFIEYLRIIREKPFELNAWYIEKFSEQNICIFSRGNITEADFRSMARTFLPIFAKDPFQIYKTTQERRRIRSLWPEGFGSYFYPPLWIGKKPKRDFKLEALGTDYMVPEAFNLEFDGIRMTVNSDGFVGLQTGDKAIAQERLNIIFGSAAISSVSCFKAKESDIQPIRFEPKSLKVDVQSELPHHSRPSSFSTTDRTRSIAELRAISKTKMQRIIQEAALIIQKDLSADFSLWFEAYDHFKNREDEQSFVMSWIVIERYLYHLLENHLTELAHKGRISAEKKEKISKLQVASLLLFLSATECIDENDYSKLVELNNSRNKLVHKGVPISRRISKKCLKYSEGIIRQHIADAQPRT
jgi:hypothetical protein